MGSLVHSTTTIPLDDALAWPNEFSWQKVDQRREYSVTGALLVESGARAFGRAITLQGDEQTGWITRAQLAQLRTLVSAPGIVMTLTFRGQSFSVMFDHEAGALDSTPVVDFDTQDAADKFFIVLRFIEVQTP